MQHVRSLLALALVAAPVSSQNFVTNGDFSAGITGWTEGGYSVTPGIETYDTAGLGASQCYACSPGGQVTPPPYLPNYIEQTVLIAPGLPYEFSAEIAVDRTVLVSNADAGTFWVEIGGVEVARTTLGGFTSGFPQRARICARFALTTGGPLTMRINFHRTYLTNTNTPRARIDDITLQIASGPMLCVTQNRQIAASLTADVFGAPSEATLYFLSPTRLQTGIVIPGINGAWFLDPARMFLFFSGATNANGQLSLPLGVPNDPALLSAVIRVQGLQVSAAPQITLGHDHFLTFVK